MGRLKAGGPDLASVAKDFTLADTTPGPWVDGLIGHFNVVIGSFTGTLVLEESYDGGNTAIPSTTLDGAPATFTAPGAYVARNDEPGVQHRLRATSITGTANCRLSCGPRP